MDTLRAALPEQTYGWKAVPGEDLFYDKKTIFDYINGEAEVYLAYNMNRCLSRRYKAGNESPIVLDIFDMGSSKDAFGIFTHDQDGEALRLGQGGLYNFGWLRFWKDRFFISIFAEKESPAAKKSVRNLGGIVASLINKEGPIPAILSRLPKDGLQDKSVRYLHHHNVLNYHYYFSDENILNLGTQTEAVLSTYRLGEETGMLLLVTYASADGAEKALEKVLTHYLPDSEEEGTALLEDGKWSAVRVRHNLLLIVLEAGTRRFAEDLLKRVLKAFSR